MSSTASTATTTAMPDISGSDQNGGSIKRKIIHTSLVESDDEDDGARGNSLLPNVSQARPNGQLPNTPLAASVISALLGGLFASSLTLLAVPYAKQLGSQSWSWVRPQFVLYAGAMGLFHLLEFWTTAGWNPNKLSIDSFLLNNGVTYHIAHLVGVAEYLISSYVWPSKYESFWNTAAYTLPVLTLLALGQTLRSLAMIHAAQSFSHIVKAVKHDDHVLITNGVYRFFRHPSYVGFFYWALATQLLLGNIVSSVGFALVLGRFFYKRIIDEERHLVRFFGNDYIAYRKRVGTGLPFPIPS